MSHDTNGQLPYSYFTRIHTTHSFLPCAFQPKLTRIPGLALIVNPIIWFSFDLADTLYVPLIVQSAMFKVSHTFTVCENIVSKRKFSNKVLRAII